MERLKIVFLAAYVCESKGGHIFACVAGILSLISYIFRNKSTYSISWVVIASDVGVDGIQVDLYLLFKDEKVSIQASASCRFPDIIFG